ncbi:glycoside hydrolase family 30 beta sandwich domain-containing protein [Mucilaginibacter sp.]|uniref:glycoside hydrolase family 30 protein n=1 Tax=Mucilaginibacter sp. TaxID=1882438 RepID=UPI002638EFC7|nr:glycoside hydrolase family 30 beta sandwich domain-containing protein [Mucilaginibacter sp.]MDB4925064.1 xynC [Mucilaginibacter sp.]
MKRKGNNVYSFTVILIAILAISSCKKQLPVNGGQSTGTPVIPVIPVTTVKTDVTMWLTQSDQSALLQKQNIGLIFNTTTNQNATITVDTAKTYQTIDGFGYTLTGGSASLINALPSAQKDDLLKELFLTDTTHIGVSYLRISLGASDLSAAPFTYDDLPAGQTADPTLQYFSIAQEMTDLVPILKKIIALNPTIKIFACPWSAPTWMKTNNSFKGGSLSTAYYDAYAKYFIKYIQAMKAQGITIDAVTPQNEPLNPYNNPSLVMQAGEQAAFIGGYLGPQFKAAGITTKIIAYDHNTDRPDYPIAVLGDATANQYVDGSAFHLYAGNISTLTAVHNAYPDKNVYFTEQWVGAPSNFGGDLSWHVNNLIIGATRNWSRNVLEWNLAADANYGPHTTGGCSTCLGALTIASTAVTRNVAYYIIAHASKFVRPGSVRIDSNVPDNLTNVAFKTPDGKKVLIVLNTSAGLQTFNIKFNNKILTATLAGGAVATFVW